MPSPYDDGWLDMRDVELQLNDPRTKSIVLPRPTLLHATPIWQRPNLTALTLEEAEQLLRRR